MGAIALGGATKGAVVVAGLMVPRAHRGGIADAALFRRARVRAAVLANVGAFRLALAFASHGAVPLGSAAVFTVIGASLRRLRAVANRGFVAAAILSAIPLGFAAKATDARFVAARRVVADASLGAAGSGMTAVGTVVGACLIRPEAAGRVRTRAGRGAIPLGGSAIGTVGNISAGRRRIAEAFLRAAAYGSTAVGAHRGDRAVGRSETVAVKRVRRVGGIRGAVRRVRRIGGRGEARHAQAERGDKERTEQGMELHGGNLHKETSCR